MYAVMFSSYMLLARSMKPCRAGMSCFAASCTKNCRFSRERQHKRMIQRQSHDIMPVTETHLS